MQGNAVANRLQHIGGGLGNGFFGKRFLFFGEVLLLSIKLLFQNIAAIPISALLRVACDLGKVGRAGFGRRSATGFVAAICIDNMRPKLASSSLFPVDSSATITPILPMPGAI